MCMYVRMYVCISHYDNMESNCKTDRHESLQDSCICSNNAKESDYMGTGKDHIHEVAETSHSELPAMRRVSIENEGDPTTRKFAWKEERRRDSAHNVIKTVTTYAVFITLVSVHICITKYRTELKLWHL